MGTIRRIAVVAGAALVTPFLGVSAAPAELPVTIPGTVTSESAIPALTDVTVSDTGSSDRVVLTFIGDALPEVIATADQPPFGGIPGIPIKVAGAAFVRLRMFPASGVSWASCPSGGAPTPGPGEVVTAVHFTCQGVLPGSAPVVRSERLVPVGTDDDVLLATVEALLAGPTADDAARGLSSWFSPATAGMVQSATISPGGQAVVDLDPALASTIPGASSSAGSEQLLRELDATVLGLDAVDSVAYTFDGSCEAFFGWLQRECVVRTSATAGPFLWVPTYLGPERVPGTTATVTEVVQLEDFESQLVWVIGLRADVEVTVTTATSPSRVIVEIPHVAPPAPAAAAQPTFTG